MPASPRRYTLGIALLTLAALSSPNVWAQEPLWQQTNGPFGGYVSHLTASPRGYVFAAVDGSIYRSSDDGQTWANTSTPPVYEIVDLETNANGVLFALPPWAVPVKTCCPTSSDWGPFRSLDDGATWEPTPVGPDSGVPYNLAVGAGNRVLAHTDRHVYKTDDDGERWEAVSFGADSSYEYVLAFTALRTGLMAALTDSATFVSEDNGESWEQYEHSLSDAYSMQFLTLTADGTLYGITDALIRSADNGATWTVVPLPEGMRSVRSLRSINDEHILIGTASGSYLSTEGASPGHPTAPVACA